MGKEMKISEIREKYRDQWVVVKVTKRDKYEVPFAGLVLFHGEIEEEILDKGFGYKKENPDVDLYFFYTGDLVPKGVGVMLGYW
ncbi:MAG: hypothetical protein D6813_10070 [Calditrichaeota bacterium]|nr:MAG: hypothetical protein D6813_10070 [Calditrichota bacterium]